MARYCNQLVCPKDLTVHGRGAIKDTNLIERDPAKYENPTDDEILVARGSNPNVVHDFRCIEDGLIEAIDSGRDDTVLCQDDDLDDEGDDSYEMLYQQWLDELAENDESDIMTLTDLPEVTTVSRIGDIVSQDKITAKDRLPLIGGRVKKVEDLPSRIGSRRFVNCVIRKDVFESRMGAHHDAASHSWKYLRIDKQFCRHQ